MLNLNIGEKQVENMTSCISLQINRFKCSGREYVVLAPFLSHNFSIINQLKNGSVFITCRGYSQYRLSLETKDSVGSFNWRHSSTSLEATKCYLIPCSIAALPYQKIEGYITISYEILR